VDRDGWMDLLDLEEDEVPRLLVLEGTWWRQKALDSRLPLLTEVRELGMPDLWHGWYGDIPVAYCPAYGAPRAVEPVHVLGIIGTVNVVQIGSCGSLQPELTTGDIVLPERATIGEGTSQYYGGKGVAEANLGRVARAASLLFVWDELPARSWTEQFTVEEQRAQAQAGAAVFEVALELA
jgi:uridine phosphorylase